MRKINRVSLEDKTHSVGTYLTHGDTRANRTVTHPRNLMIDARRREVLRLRTELKPDGSRRKLHEIREIIINTEGMLPDGMDYNIASVTNDLLVCIQSISDEIKDIAHEYLPYELDKLNKAEETIWDSIYKASELLENIDFSDPEEINSQSRLLERATNSIDKSTRSLERVMSRRAKMLPLEVPKQLQVDKRVMNITLDDFIKAQKEVSEADGNDIVEGTFEES